MGTPRINNPVALASAAVVTLALACGALFVALERRSGPETPREAILFMTLLYGLLFGAVLLLGVKLRRTREPRYRSPPYFLLVGGSLALFVGFPIYCLAVALLG